MKWKQIRWGVGVGGGFTLLLFLSHDCLFFLPPLVKTWPVSLQEVHWTAGWLASFNLTHWHLMQDQETGTGSERLLSFLSWFIPLRASWPHCDFSVCPKKKKKKSASASLVIRRQPAGVLFLRPKLRHDLSYNKTINKSWIIIKKKNKKTHW